MPPHNSKHPSPPAIPGIKAEPGLAHVLRREVAQLLDRGDNTRFPGAQPVSFAAKHLAELQQQDYYLCEKSDGIRCLMYLTRDGDREVTYLIDRKNDYYFVDGLHFPLDGDEQAFNVDTIVDGELVNDREPDGTIQLRYLVFDCLTIAGKSLIERPLDKRIGYFRQNIFMPFDKLYQKYPQERKFMPFEVSEKNFDRAYGIEKVLRQTLPNLPHGSDGLIFTCVSSPYRFGTDPHIMKWKPADENSVDFKIEFEYTSYPDLDSEDERRGITEPYPDWSEKPIIHLLVGADGRKYKRWDTLHVTTEEWDALTGLQEPLDERIVECYKDVQHRWRYMRFRDDKLEPNHLSTVESVIESIEDRIGEKELMAVQTDIRNAWKSREQKNIEHVRRGSMVGEERQMPILNEQKRKHDAESPSGEISKVKRRIG